VQAAVAGVKLNQSAAATRAMVEASMTPRERERAAQFKRAADPYAAGSGEFFEFESYAATHFAPRSAGCCRGAVPAWKLARFSRKPLPGGALTTAAERAGAGTEAAALFSAVQAYMGDARKPARTSDAALAKSVVALALRVLPTAGARGGGGGGAATVTKGGGGGGGGGGGSTGEGGAPASRAMRDECYCQLVKQTTAHLAPRVELRGGALHVESS
jgi:uncharacterized membrane protein YgcG